jgi:hypothetical protein
MLGPPWDSWYCGTVQNYKRRTGGRMKYEFYLLEVLSREEQEGE